MLTCDVLLTFSLRYLQVLAEISVPQQQERPGMDAAFLEWKQLSADLLRRILDEIHEWEAQTRDASQNLRVLFSKLERTGEHMSSGQRKDWVHSCDLLLQMLVPPFRCANFVVTKTHTRLHMRRTQMPLKELTVPLDASVSILAALCVALRACAGAE